MNFVLDIMRAAVGGLLGLTASWPPLLTLTLWSLVLGVLAAWAFKYTSYQRGLKQVADWSRASLLRLRLYGGDDVVTFKAIGGLLAASLLRLVYSLSPLVVLLLPFALILGQMAMYYEFRPLPPGRTAVVKMQLSPEGWGQRGDLKLVSPADAQDPRRHDDSATREIVWQFVPAGRLPGDRVEWQFGDGAKVAKQLVVDETLARLQFASPVRGGPALGSWGGFGEAILFPGEPLFEPGDPVQRIEVNYPTRSTPVLGWDVHWVITFFVLSIVGALLAKPWLRVQF